MQVAGVEVLPAPGQELPRLGCMVGYFNRIAHGHFAALSCTHKHSTLYAGP